MFSKAAATRSPLLYATCFLSDADRTGAAAAAGEQNANWLSAVQRLLTKVFRDATSGIPST